MAHILKRALEVLRTEGPPGIVHRLAHLCGRHFSSIHMLVLVSSFDSLPDIVARQDKQTQAMKRALATPLDFKQVLLSDEQEIDELTELDPWKYPKSLTLDKLREGWICFVAKKDDRILACAWVVVNRDFDLLERPFALGPGEAFYWRGFCVPSCRGGGIFPQLMAHIVEQVGRERNITRHITLVLASNVAVQHSLAKIAWKVVGRAGYVEIFGMRFQYLWGREAFKDTQKRFFLHRVHQSSH